MSIPNRLRFVALLFLVGGVVAFFYVVRISGWERVDGGARFVVPDTSGQQHVKSEILSLLGQYGGIAIGLGVALLIAAQVYAARQRRAVREGQPFPKPVRVGLARTTALFAFAIVVGLGVTFGYRWYDYVANAASPYDEVGIEINSRLPESLRAWGCGRLKERFARAIPPYGCSDATGRNWR